MLAREVIYKSENVGHTTRQTAMRREMRNPRAGGLHGIQREEQESQEDLCCGPERDTVSSSLEMRDSGESSEYVIANICIYILIFIKIL